MRGRTTGARSSFTLLTAIAAATTAAAIAACSAGASHAGAAAASPGELLTSARGSSALPGVTFSPRSSLARLDLRSGNVSPLAVGSFFSVADPSLSPSGRLAFIASGCASCESRLAIVKGGRATTLTQALSVTWMGDEALLMSAARHGEDTDVWLVRPNGRGHELEWLTAAAKRISVETEQAIVVSPDRRTLLFSGEGGAERHSNYIVDLLRRRLLPLSGDSADAPTFSPDGRTIAYQQVSRGGDWDVCLSRISLRAASHARCFRSSAGNDREPAFLQGGRQVVFSSDRASRRDGVSSLYLLDVRTGSVRRLTPAGYDAVSPTVAPNGRSVTFVRRALLPLP